MGGGGGSQQEIRPSVHVLKKLRHFEASYAKFHVMYLENKIMALTLLHELRHVLQNNINLKVTSFDVVFFVSKYYSSRCNSCSGMVTMIGYFALRKYYVALIKAVFHLIFSVSNQCMTKRHNGHITLNHDVTKDELLQVSTMVVPLLPVV